VRGRDFHGACSKFHRNAFVDNEGNRAILQRENHVLAAQMRVTRIVWMNRNGGVAEHRFRGASSRR
jgi:hypothetical protein